MRSHIHYGAAYKANTQHTPRGYQAILGIGPLVYMNGVEVDTLSCWVTLSESFPFPKVYRCGFCIH